MAIMQANKAAVINPLKLGQPLGGIIAMQGFYRSLSIVHGGQGCAAFIRQLITGHYREPCAMQTSALQEMNVIFGSGRNLTEALDAVIAKHRPDIVTVLSTALTELAGGDDLKAEIRQYMRQRDVKDTLVVPVSVPDFTGSLESGYARTVEAVIEAVLDKAKRNQTAAGAAGATGGTAGILRPRPVKGRIVLLPGAHLTPGDVTELKDLIASFGLEVIALPDLSTSLSGHLLTGHTPLSRGGQPLDVVEQMLTAEAVIAIGSHMERAACKLQAVGIPVRVFPRSFGLAATDELIEHLQQLARMTLPSRYIWQRENLVDCMLDAHFTYLGRRAVVALEPDHLLDMAGWLQEMGVKRKGLVSPVPSPALEKLDETVWVGDLDDLERMAGHGDLWISNSHGKQGADRVGAHFVPCGFPVLHRIGAGLTVSVGYRGAIELTMRCGNLLLEREVGAHD
ncbi:nitrogenase iron-molybdenum cofactor biosynthesis protein NifN [Gorillibacterium massiliense]|uniref:nitrogenase iron-molybdenum cofactor biosynthesis protein NifN n=1 Tax=Gorillibacterium massiliense TaxID=1280390 RepID=UPI0004B14223|nr:nitrogenase iron-molybdenum cofactor biosynthesis protein NifN [Gorillibacterium massiliense]